MGTFSATATPQASLSDAFRCAVCNVAYGLFAPIKGVAQGAAAGFAYGLDHPIGNLVTDWAILKGATIGGGLVGLFAGAAAGLKSIFYEAPMQFAQDRPYERPKAYAQMLDW